MRAGAGLRLLRAAVFAAACTALAAAGHLAAGAHATLPAWAVAAGWLTAAAAAAPFAGRERRSLPALAAALTAGQLALHVLFSLGQGTVSLPAGNPGGDGGAVALAARLLCNDGAALSTAEALRLITDAGLTPPAGPGTVHTAGHGASPGDALPGLASAPMLLGHLLAALATGWLLRRGDAALWQLVRLAAHGPGGGPLLPALPGLVALRRAVTLALRLRGGLLPGPATVRPPGSGHHPTPATLGTVLPDTVTRRGPPPATALWSLAA